MTYHFNADEMFEVAIRIEENGARFYKTAARCQSDPGSREMLEKLEAMESSHQRTFEKMRARLSEAEKSPTAFDPEGEASQYLMAMADSHGGEGSPAAADALTGDESIADIIDIAIGLEKESILFYLGLKDLVSASLGSDKLDDIIAEERRHIIQLNGILKKL